MAPPVGRYDAVILGAGAAGLFCAAIAGQRGRRVLLIDHADHPGKKILISGGGRCNFTNKRAPPDCYISQNPHFAKSALQRYRPTDFIALVDRYGIAWHEKTLGQLFCDGSALQIVDMLCLECARGGVTIELGRTIREVSHCDGHYRLDLESATVSAPRLVIATGGLSIPKLGATGFAYDLARQYGLEVVPPRPALVPLTLQPEDRIFGNLTGISGEVVARCGNVSFRDAALFTHKGLSGPAILQISSYWKPGTPINLDFTPVQEEGWLLQLKRERPRANLGSALAKVLPDRLARLLSERLDRAGELANMSDRTLKDIEARLAAWEFRPAGTEGFAKAEVTAGGVATSGLSSRTFEAKTIRGLHFIGEAVDVTGWLGGYNFQWAWASAWACAQEL
jgi:predicted Rossmann fold flavoprotein